MRTRPFDRRGVSIVELLIGITLLALVVVGLAASSLYASRHLTHARIRLEAAEFLQSELERLSAIPYGELASGKRSVPNGASIWTVEDSVSYRRILLITNYSPTPRYSIWDTIVAYRPKP